MIKTEKERMTGRGYQPKVSVGTNVCLLDAYILLYMYLFSL